MILWISIAYKIIKLVCFKDIQKINIAKLETPLPSDKSVTKPYARTLYNMPKEKTMIGGK